MTFWLGLALIYVTAVVASAIVAAVAMQGDWWDFVDCLMRFALIILGVVVAVALIAYGATLMGVGAL